jgi:hypothetical protein
MDGTRFDDLSRALAQRVDRRGPDPSRVNSKEPDRGRRSRVGRRGFLLGIVLSGLALSGRPRPAWAQRYSDPCNPAVRDKCLEELKQARRECFDSLLERDLSFLTNAGCRRLLSGAGGMGEFGCYLRGSGCLENSCTDEGFCEPPCPTHVECPEGQACVMEEGAPWGTCRVSECRSNVDCRECEICVDPRGGDLTLIGGGVCRLQPDWKICNGTCRPRRDTCCGNDACTSEEKSCEWRGVCIPHSASCCDQGWRCPTCERCEGDECVFNTDVYLQCENRCYQKERGNPPIRYKCCSNDACPDNGYWKCCGSEADDTYTNCRSIYDDCPMR